jgi:transcriptional regulator with XRE-family HTH domain
MNNIEQLRRIKKQKGYTYDAMAKAMGVTLVTVFRWLHKQNEPSPMGREKIAAYVERIALDKSSDGRKS